MFGFLKKRFFTAMTCFSCNALKCVSMNNQECKIRSEIIDINSNINDPYAKLCIKNINVKVFNLMSKKNERRHIQWHETCKCKCRLDTSVCNNEQRWNNNECRCECKELIDNGSCDKGFI